MSYIWTDSREKLVKVSSGGQPPNQPPNQPPQPPSPKQKDEIILLTAAAIAFAIGLSIAEAGRR